MSSRQRSLVRGALVVSAACLLPAGAGAQTPSQPVIRDTAAELACGADAAAAAPTTTLRVTLGHVPGQALFGPGDPIIIRGGTAQGVKVGQEYFVRRVIPDQFTHKRSDGVPTVSIHTAGWVRVVETAAEGARATVIRACDAIQDGDYLEPFERPAVSDAGPAGEPDYAHPGHVILGDDRRQMGAQGDLMVLDRGSDHGLRAGQRLTIFRQTAGGAGPVAPVGEAVAMSVKPETSIIRIEKATHPIQVGDLVAIHR